MLRFFATRTMALAGVVLAGFGGIDPAQNWWAILIGTGLMLAAMEWLDWARERDLEAARVQMWSARVDSMFRRAERRAEDR